MASDAAHDLAHLDRVWRNCQRIAEGEGVVAGSTLLAAAYFHDLVNLPKDDPNRVGASTMSADTAEELLAPFSFSEEDIATIRNAIEAHSYSANIPARNIEAKILRDADRLDALGLLVSHAPLLSRVLWGVNFITQPTHFQQFVHLMIYGFQSITGPQSS